MNRFSLAAVLLILMTPSVNAQDQAMVDAGAAVYDMYCSTCHGQRLRSPGGSFDLRELTADDRERFNTSVLDGVRMMPAWRGTVSEEELDQLWAYVRAYAYE